LVGKIPEGHANLQQILQQKRVFNKPVENRRESSGERSVVNGENRKCRCLTADLLWLKFNAE
jgi:hypothetical protein